jgi:citrate lyase beta subunit
LQVNRRDINYFELGATLYVPIMNHNIEAILKVEKFSFLKSIVICLEDSTSDRDFSSGMARLQEILKNYVQSDLKVFIRARNISNLQDILKLDNIDMVDGFAIAKFGLDNIDDYLNIFIKHNSFYLMPILEGKDVFYSDKLLSIANELKPFRDRILSIRVGGEDILSILDMRRDCTKSLYSIMPLYLVLSNILNIFKSNGFHISSPVFSCFNDNSIFLDEIDSDIEHSIFNKTTIHPNQVKIIQDRYRVKIEDYEIARKILLDNRAVFAKAGVMYEKKTHTNWANQIIKRYENFGLVENG